MHRITAFLTHLLISALIIGATMALIFLVWYPSPSFGYEGAIAPLKILVVVDLVLGPLLTLIIFKSGKKGLKFDLTLIACVQIAALLYGSYTIWSERPLYLSFAIDRFFLIPASQVDNTQLPEAMKQEKPLIAIHRVFAEFIEGKEGWQLMVDTGKDIHQTPQLYRNFENNFKLAVPRRLDVEILKNSELGKREIDKFLSDHPGTIEDYALFPMHGTKKDGTIVLNMSDGSTAGYIHEPLEAIIATKKKQEASENKAEE